MRFVVGTETCDIWSGTRALAELPAVIAKLNPDKILVVADKHFDGLDCITRALSRRAIRPLYLGGGENAKTGETLLTCLNVATAELSRASIIIALGGATICNLTGVVAGLTFRGISLIHVPTTLMAQVDGAIGLKQAVNSPSAKNAIGLYKLPRAVIADSSFLETLPTEEIRHGLAECYKVALAVRPDLVANVELALRVGHSCANLSEVSEQCMKEKVARLSDDPMERGELAFLELGHGIAHAIETASNGAVHHGTAVALGILLESKYSCAIGLLEDQNILAEVETVVTEHFGACRELRRAGRPEDIVKYLLLGNNRSRSGPRLSLLQRPGRTKLVDGISENVMYAVLKCSWPTP